MLASLKRVLISAGVSLGFILPALAGPTTPPAGNYVINVSTNYQKPAFNVSSGTIRDQLILPYITPGQCTTTDVTGAVIGTTCGGGGGGSTSTILNQSNRQYGAVFNVDSGTINGPFSIYITTTTDQRIDVIEAPGFYVNLTTAISNDSGAQTDVIYAKLHNTSPNSVPAVDGIALHGRSVDNSNSNGQLIGVMGEVFGQSLSPAYTGLWGTGGWASDLPGGTTSTIEGLRVIAQITNLAGNVPRSTGTLKLIDLPDLSNGTGAPNQSWMIYSNGSYPTFYRGFNGFGQRLPSAPLHVQVSTNTQFGLIIASGPTVNVADVNSSNNTMTVTNTGIVSDRGETITGPSTIVTSQNPAGTPDDLSITYNVASGVSTRATGLRSNVNQTSTSAGALSVAVGVQAVVTDTNATNGTLEGLDGRATGAGYAPQYAGAVLHGNWQSDQVGGTTSTVVGLQITDNVTLADGVTAVSTGTLKQLLISDPTGSGASGQSWALYSTSRFPAYYNNFIGIGDKAPTASLSVAASTNTQYAIVSGSVPYFSGTFPSSNYNFTVTNDGQVSVKKIIWADGTTSTTSASGGGGSSGNGVSVYPATATASFPFGLSASSAVIQGPFTVVSLTAGTNPSTATLVTSMSNSSFGNDTVLWTRSTSGSLVITSSSPAGTGAILEMDNAGISSQPCNQPGATVIDGWCFSGNAIGTLASPTNLLFSPTVVGTITVTGSGGLIATYGITGGSVTVNGSGGGSYSALEGSAPIALSRYDILFASATPQDWFGMSSNGGPNYLVVGSSASTAVGHLALFSGNGSIVDGGVPGTGGGGSTLTLSSFTATQPILYNNATGAFSATPISLSTGVTGSLPAASIAAGSLGTSVIASSITLAAMYGSPTLNAANITNIQGAQVGSGVPAANIASGILGAQVIASSLSSTSGSVSAGTNVTITGNWPNVTVTASGSGGPGVSSGTIVQTIISSVTAASTTATTSFVPTALAVTITPKSASDFVRLSVHGPISSSAGAPTYITIAKAGVNMMSSNGCSENDPDGTLLGTAFASGSCVVYDTSPVASATTYTVQVKTVSGTGGFGDANVTSYLAAEEINPSGGAIGAVNFGNGQLAYYPSSGTAVSGDPNSVVTATSTTFKDSAGVSIPAGVATSSVTFSVDGSVISSSRTFDRVMLMNTSDYYVACLGGRSITGGSLTTQTMTGNNSNNTIMATLCYFPGGTVNKLEFAITGSSLDFVSMGMYNEGGNLVLYTGILCSTSTPAVTLAASIPIVTSASTNCGSPSIGLGSYFAPGFYWFASTESNGSTGTTVRALNADANFTTFFDADQIQWGKLSTTATLGGLPATAAFPPNAAQAVNVPLFKLVN